MTKVVVELDGDACFLVGVLFNSELMSAIFQDIAYVFLEVVVEVVHWCILVVEGLLLFTFIKIDYFALMYKTLTTFFFTPKK